MRNRLKELRAAINLSQDGLGERVRLSRQAVNAIENGRGDPSLEVAFRVARVFGLPIEAIFTPPEDIVLTTAFDYQDRLATAIDEVGILKEMGESGWELTGFGPLVLHFRRPIDELGRRPWEYQRLTTLLDAGARQAMERQGWKYVGAWVVFHYFKRLAGLG